MKRLKERRKILHQPSTHEIIYSLQSRLSYSRLLLDHTTNAIYKDFLGAMIEQKFYSQSEDKLSIKKIAADFKMDSAKITQWIRKIYDDIFELNYDHPEHFQKQGINVCLYFSYYDSHCMIYTNLTAIPREFETVNFSFVKAKVGVNSFWVKRVEHEMLEEPIVSITLEGQSLNRYREFILEKAMFQGYLSFWDTYSKHSHEIDEALQKLYRN